MSIKKISLIMLLILIIVALGAAIFLVPSNKVLVSKSESLNNEECLNIVTTNFATYDFVRAIADDNVNLTFIMGPGKDSHSFEPTAKDIINIQNSDLFIYIGGDMESWVDKVLDSTDIKANCFCIADYIDFMEEKSVDGAMENHEHNHEEHNEAFDEHIWSSPNNAIKMVTLLKDIIINMDKDNQKVYEENADNYIAEIKLVQSEIEEIVDNKVRDRLVFGDKMPMQYFLDEFNLKASAAFDGCSTENEPSASTIAYLVNKVKEENIPVILYIELNTGDIANLIANEVYLNTGNKVKTMQIQTLHNVSKDDFKNNETYVSLMRRNLDVLKLALQ